MATDAGRVMITMDELTAKALGELRAHRRERIATAVLAGMVAHCSDGLEEWFVRNALALTDALIAALDAEPTDGE